MAHDVFISYASPDRATAEAICAALESSNISCWFAPRDVEVGKVWVEAIVDAIDAGRIFILVLSSSSNSSPQVTREVERAASKDIPIIPIRIDNTPLSKAIDFFTSRHQWLDAQKPPLEKHLPQLVTTVEKLLAQEAAIRTKKELEESRERAKREAEEAKRVQEAIAKAKEEAEAVMERAKLEREEARKAQEAAIRAKKEEEAVRERTKREAEKSAAALVEKKPARAQMPAGGRKRLTKPVWLSAGIALPLLGLVIALFFILKPQPNSIPADLTECIQLGNPSVSLSKNEVNGSETFYATITGHITVTEDLPVPISEASLNSQVIAELAADGTTVTLNPSYTIAIKPFPSQKGETAEINQVVPLLFPAEAKSGDYDIFGELVEAKVKVGFWLDATEYLPREQSLGSVKYVAAEPWYSTVTGYVREAGTNAPISSATVSAFDYDTLKGFWLGRGGTTTNSEGHYALYPGASLGSLTWMPGTYAVRVEAPDYASEWFENTYTKDKAKPLTFTTPAEMSNINFTLERGGSISGKVIADASQKGISGMHVNAVDFNTYEWIAGVNTNSDGTYTLGGLPAGTYWVAAVPSVYGQPYAAEGRLATVSVGQDTPGIDFSLASIAK
jgi:hypothetical protein